MATHRYHAIEAETSNTDNPPRLSAPRNQLCPPRKPLANSSVNHNRTEGPRRDQDDGSDRVPQPLLIEAAAAEGAKLLQNRTHQIIVRSLVDVCHTVLPCLFISLGIVAAYLDGQETSSYGRKVQEAARLGPTIFPIAFAAIVARFNRHLARWQVERGQCLGVRCSQIILKLFPTNSCRYSSS